MATHFIFELAAYVIAFRLLLFRNLNQDHLPPKQRSFILIGALLGAIIGVKFLLIFQYFNIVLAEPSEIVNLFFGTGKTIVGGLLGGLIGVEITKKILRINSSTGDVFVYPLIVGMIIGRIGCFLTGLEDETFGLPTNLPWGVDFGDGIARHPTQIYEIIFLLAWAGFLRWCKRFQLESGDLFKLFMIGYLSFRLGFDFLKPHPFNWLVFSGIQIACLLGLIYYRPSILRLFKLFRGRSHDAKRLSILRSDQ